MNLTQARRKLRSYVDARITVQLISSPGLGKSDMIENAVTEFSKQDNEEWGLCTLMAAALTPPDVLGYLVPGKRTMRDKDGREEELAISEFTMPPWMMSNDGRPMNSFKRGIIFLDEWDKVDPDTKRALAQVLLKGVAGNWGVHEGISVITAANRAEDRSGSTKEYDFIINRRAEIHIIPDVKSWEDWALKHGINPLFVAFAVKNVDVVFGGKVPDKQGPYCTPRSLVMLSRLFDAEAKAQGSSEVNVSDEGERSLLTEMATGLVGVEAANHFITWCQMRTEVPDFETIVKDPIKTEIPKRPDGKMLVCYDLAHRVTTKTADAVVDYALRLPPEFQLTFGAAAVKRDFKLLSHPAFMKKFVPKNAGLVTLVSGN